VRDAGGWPLDLLKRVGLDDLPEKWPKRMLRPGQVVGELTDEAAAETGLRKGLPIAQGMMDSYAAAIACNVFVPGRLSLSLGTSSCYLALTAAPVSDRRLLGPVPDPFGDKRWVMQGGQTSAGAPVRWFSDELGGGRSNDVLDNEAAAIPAGSEGVFAVDTWQGSRSPHRAPSARGGFFGVSVGHSRGHLYRSLLEAVAYGGREILETMHEASVDCRSIVACGGGSRSDLWMQIHADVLQRQISVLDCKHAAALGAAMCAAVGAGFETDLQSAAAAMSMNARHFEPRRETREVYDFGYQRYRRAYQDLEAIRAAHPPSLYE
jgi:sugar (pentulose or hexulose) kinase